MVDYRSVTGRPASWYKELYETRRRAADPDIARMLMAQAYLNDEVDLPLPELNKNERPAVANLAAQGMDQLGRRIASLDPHIFFSPLGPSKKAQDEASDRGRIIRAWREKNGTRILNAKRARHLLAYASMPAILYPHPKLKIPCWQVRNPLQTFPSDKEFQDPHPDDCVFTTERSYRWMLDNYPNVARSLRKGVDSLGNPWDDMSPDLDKKFTIIEYVDAQECTMVAMGEPKHQDNVYLNPEGMDEFVECCILNSSTNWAGMCPAVVPGAVTLDKQRGYFDSIFGMYHAQALLMAYSLIATQKAIFPTPWAISNPGEVVKVHKVPDKYSGIPGEISGGTLEFQQIDPAFRAMEVGDRLEYASRMTAGLPSEFGGMSPTNVRTGRRGSQVMGETIDFTISESQDVTARSTYAENQIAMAIDSGYFPAKNKSYFIMTRSFTGEVKYSPTELWGTKGGTEHIVDYPMGGVDLQNLPIEGGQRVQMGTMSRRRFMQIDPAIPDYEAEEQQILIESIQAGYVASIAQLAADPMAQAFQPQDMGRLEEKLRAGKTLPEAVAEVQKEAQERQATEAPAGSPETMPGMAQPGMGGEQPAPQGAPGLNELPQLLSQLGGVQMAQKNRSTNGSI